MRKLKSVYEKVVWLNPTPEKEWGWSQTIEYTRNRKAFGKTILDNQVVHFKLAEMQTEVELLRALIYRAAEALIAGEDVTRLATMAGKAGYKGYLGLEYESATGEAEIPKLCAVLRDTVKKVSGA